MPIDRIERGRLDVLPWSVPQARGDDLFPAYSCSCEIGWREVDVVAPFSLPTIGQCLEKCLCCRGCLCYFMSLVA
jgi:hypothetical protein